MAHAEHDTSADALAAATPEAVVHRYLTVMYNERRLDLVPELIADPEIRHAPGETRVMTLAENVERLTRMFEQCPVLRFDPKVVIAQGELVSVAWNGFSTQLNGKSYEFAAVELFRVVDGKITEIWNSREARGLWT